jgi:CheY-like chemotaxis protein
MENHTGARLLILDDEPTVGMVLSRVAERIGFAVMLTDSPQDFFGQLAPWQPSHIAIDLSMPEMSGVEVLDRLAQTGCTARVIITSGAALGDMNDALDHARALGMRVSGALPKPFSVSLLRALLEEGREGNLRLQPEAG